MFNCIVSIQIRYPLTVASRLLTVSDEPDWEKALLYLKYSRKTYYYYNYYYNGCQVHVAQVKCLSRVL